MNEYKCRNCHGGIADKGDFGRLLCGNCKHLRGFPAKTRNSTREKLTPQTVFSTVSDIDGFVAVDVETADDDHGTVCEIGLCWVEDGKPVTRSWIVQPPGNRHSAKNSAIHGLTSEHTKDAPEFPEIWAEIAEHIEGRTMVAHNAQFDMGVLQKCLDSYDIDETMNESVCTLEAWREAEPNKGSSYGLAAFGETVGGFDHHTAGADAEMALRLACTIVNNSKHDSLTETVAELEVAARFRNKPTGGNWVEYRKESDFVASGTVDETHPFHNQTIVVTGQIKGMERNDVRQAIADSGGNSGGNITKKTDVLVVAGGYDPDDPYQPMTGKLKKAIANGVTIISDTEFLEILNN